MVTNGESHEERIAGLEFAVKGLMRALDMQLDKLKMAVQAIDKLSKLVLRLQRESGNFGKG